MYHCFHFCCHHIDSHINFHTNFHINFHIYFYINFNFFSQSPKSSIHGHSHSHISNGTLPSVAAAAAVAAVAAVAANNAPRDDDKEKKKKNKQMSLQSFLNNWKLNLSISSTIPEQRKASLRDIDLKISTRMSLSLSSTSDHLSPNRNGLNTPRTGSCTPMLISPNAGGADDISQVIQINNALIASQCRRDSQTTSESTSLRTSHANSRRDSGTSSTARSRRNSDCDAYKRQENNESSQMFPDLPSATNNSNHNGHNNHNINNNNYNNNNGYNYNNSNSSHNNSSHNIKTSSSDTNVQKAFVKQLQVKINIKLWGQFFSHNY